MCGIALRTTFLLVIRGIALRAFFLKIYAALHCSPFFNYLRHCAARLLF
jgi:hypothetical protein